MLEYSVHIHFTEPIAISGQRSVEKWHQEDSFCIINQQWVIGVVNKVGRFDEMKLTSRLCIRQNQPKITRSEEVARRHELISSRNLRNGLENENKQRKILGDHIIASYTCEHSRWSRIYRRNEKKKNKTNRSAEKKQTAKTNEICSHRIECIECIQHSLFLCAYSEEHSIVRV